MGWRVKGVCPLRGLAYGPKPWGGGWAGGSKVYGFGQVCIFGGRKLTSFEGSCIWPKAFSGGGLEGQRSMDLDEYAFFGAKTDVL